MPLPQWGVQRWQTVPVTERAIMAEFLNRAITVGDLFIAAGFGVVCVVLALIFVVVAVNMGWVK
jgi:hypothetical protein